jgi:S-adenosylmethionine:tRNA ribosyltransferase-isomerase
MNRSDFDYHLPEHLIAQYPAAHRDKSRLLVMHRAENRLTHTSFDALDHLLQAGDVLVLNDVRVIPARLYGTRQSGGTVEILILEGWRGRITKVLLKPARRIRILDRSGKSFLAEFTGPGKFHSFLEKSGEMPLPPYIKRQPGDRFRELDRDRYQTVFAHDDGAVAAPTAGLHFTPSILNRLHEKAIETIYLTLWVGWGTFKPVDVENLADYSVDTERYRIPSETAAAVCRAKKENRRVIAVGTTSVRALESWADRSRSREGVTAGDARLFIKPGYRFKIIDGMITNFHLPASSLIMLVSALAGRKRILDAYQIAVKNEYRFYSYGDAMLIL